MFSIKSSALAAAVLAVVGLAGTSQASVQLLDFKPVPITNTTPEIVWTGTTLSAGPGSVSTGLVSPGVYDGDLAISSQAANGLQVGVALSLATGRSPVPTAGGTTYYDAGLSLTGLTASASAANFFGTLIQPLSSGTFTFTDTAGNTLLTGFISNAAITGLINTTAASVLSGSVTYTGGLVYNALVAAGVSDFSGNMSFALNSNTPLNIAGDFIIPFDANAEGHFDIPSVPEPASLSLLGLSSLALLARRRD